MNFAALGPKFGPKAQEIANTLASQIDEASIEILRKGGDITITLADGNKVVLGSTDVNIELATPKDYSLADAHDFTVALNTKITEDLKLEGFARELVRRLQNLRKEIGLEIEDRIELNYATKDKDLLLAIEKHQNYITSELLALKIAKELVDSDAYVLKIKGREFQVQIKKIEK